MAHRRVVVSVIASTIAASGMALAADQTILGFKLLVRDPGVVTKRRFIGSGREKPTSATVVGDPIANGGAVEIFANGGTSTSQTFGLPPAGWSTVTGGFKYRDGKGLFGPVKNVRIRLGSGGKFQMRVQVVGKDGSLVVVPPNPGTSACLALTLNGGDRYSVEFGPTSIITNKGPKVFKARKPLAEGVCPGSSPTTSTSTSTSLPSTSTTSTSLAPSSTTSTSTSSTTSTTIGSASPSFVFIEASGLF